jgi:hypothetical protein
MIPAAPMAAALRPDRSAAPMLRPAALMIPAAPMAAALRPDRPAAPMIRPAALMIPAALMAAALRRIAPRHHGPACSGQRPREQPARAGENQPAHTRHAMEAG